MSSTAIHEQDVLEALQLVPRQRWPEVLQYLASLRIATTETVEPAAVQTATDLAASALVGVWSDRTEVSDSRGFARQLRRQAEQRRN